MRTSSSKSKNGGKREKKAESASLKDLNPKKGLGKVKGGAYNGNRQQKTGHVP